MKRARRIEQLESVLRARGSSTAGELAAELGVSIRTMRRDLAELRTGHVTVESEAGRGGGVRLDAQRALTAIRLPTGEIVAMWLAAELSRRAGTLPWGKAAGTALDRVFSALPPTRRKELRDLLRRVVVGPPAPRELIADAKEPTPELLTVFEEAFTSRLGLRFIYTDRKAQTTKRVIEPHALLLQPPIWYVLAVDVEKHVPRMFRMDRITRPTIAREVKFVPRLDVIDELRPT